MSRLRRIWQHASHPWLADLLRNVVLCRCAVLAVIIVGLSHIAGYSLMPCPFFALTKLPCPGCGMTRAFIAMFKGDWAAMAVLHPYAPLFLLLGLVMALASVSPGRLREFLAGMMERFERRTRLPAILLLSFVLFGLIRVGFFFFMRPNAPFDSGRVVFDRNTAVRN